MNLLLAIVIGLLYAAGVYMLLRRSFVKLILGLALLSHGTNLLIFTIGGLERSAPPIIPYGEKALTGAYANPLPQALILTAIVISLATSAFAIVLMKRAYSLVGTDDVDVLVTTEK